jgi:hypothetical protein
VLSAECLGDVPHTLTAPLSLFAPSLQVWLSASFPYQPHVAAFFKTLPPHLVRYEESLKLWLVQLDIYDALVSRLQSFQFQLCVSLVELPRTLVGGLRWWLLQHLPAIPEALLPDEQVSLRLSPALLDRLLPYQLEGIRFVVKRGGRALIADEMGLGKTIQAIGVLMHYRCVACDLECPLMVVPVSLLPLLALQLQLTHTPPPHTLQTPLACASNRSE